MKILTVNEKIFRRQLTNTINRYTREYTFKIIDELEEGVYLIGTKNPLHRYKVWVDKERMLVLENCKVLPDIGYEFNTDSFFSTFFFYREMDGAKIYDWGGLMETLHITRMLIKHKWISIDTILLLLEDI